MSVITYAEGRYILSAPFDIGPRLMPSLKLSDGSRVSMAVIDRDSEGRVVYQWIVDDADHKELASAADLASEVNGTVDLEAMFATFASFVGAWVEAHNSGGRENRSIFPPWMLPWAQANHEELSMLTSTEEDS